MAPVIPFAPPLAVSPLGSVALGFPGVAGEIAPRLLVARSRTRLPTAGPLGTTGPASTAVVSSFARLVAARDEPTSLRVASPLGGRSGLSAAALVPFQLLLALLASGRVRVSSSLPSMLCLAPALVRFAPRSLVLGDEPPGLRVPALSLGLRSAFVAAALVPSASVSLTHEFPSGDDRRRQKADRPFRNQRAVTPLSLGPRRCRTSVSRGGGTDGKRQLTRRATSRRRARSRRVPRRRRRGLSRVRSRLRPRGRSRG